MCEDDGCDDCECECCECSNVFLYACFCCYAAEPVAETYSDVKQHKKEERVETPAPPLVMLRTESRMGYRIV